MKTSILPLACSALLLALPAAAQDPWNPVDRRTLSIVQTEQAVFPLRLLQTSVMNGDAWVAIDVDEKGQLTDWVVTGYSRKEFADSAVEALKQWRYLPPSLDGQPWASVRELRFDFSRTGVVVNFVGADAITNRFDELFAGHFAYRTYTLRELDRTPTPIHVVTPVSPASDPSGATHEVTVEFYIDEQGRVRLPSVDRAEAGTIYASCAITAVRGWRFDPPLCKGRPVLVLAHQQFKFVPKH